MSPSRLPDHWTVTTVRLPLDRFCFRHKSLPMSYLNTFPVGAAFLHLLRRSRWSVVAAGLLGVVGAGLSSYGWYGATVMLIATLLALAIQEVHHRRRLQEVANDIASVTPGSFFTHAQFWVIPYRVRDLVQKLGSGSAVAAPRRRL